MEEEKRKIKAWQWVVLIIIIATTIGLKIYQTRIPSVKMELKNQTLDLMLAKTLKQRYKGLGERESLGLYDGMLFSYTLAGKPTMVMRGMEFPIDIVWFNDGVVVDIAPNAQIEPGVPEDALKRYSPRIEANLVLELKADWVEKNDLKIGDRIQVFSN